jgi:hypothetical protein
MPLLGAVAAALAFAGLPAAAPPEGFRASTPLSARASAAAGVASAVHCARSADAWASFLSRRGLGPIAREILALTLIERRETFLVRRVCGTLEGWLRGVPVPLDPLADAIFTFTHETSHLRGIVNECAADHSAMARLRTVARTLFGIRNRARLDALVRKARESSGYVENC